MKKIKVITSLNKDQKLYVFNHGNFVTCLGFDVCAKRFKGLADELGYQIKAKRKGTLKFYKEYENLLSYAAEKNRSTGWRSKSELIPEFIGNEGRRVEVVTIDGEKYRFIIGKSTGFIPCHLEVKRVNSTGGGACSMDCYKSVVFLP